MWQWNKSSHPGHWTVTLYIYRGPLLSQTIHNRLRICITNQTIHISSHPFLWNQLISSSNINHNSWGASLRRAKCQTPSYNRCSNWMTKLAISSWLDVKAFQVDWKQVWPDILHQLACATGCSQCSQKDWCCRVTIVIRHKLMSITIGELLSQSFWFQICH